MESDALNISDLLDLMRRRFVVLVNTFVACVCVAVLIAFGLPSVYESTGTILIEQQDVPDTLVQSTITSYADEQIQFISQRVMSADNLGALVKRHSLYGYGKDDESLNVKSAKLKDSLLIEPISADVFNHSTGRPGQITIAFTVMVRHESPELAHVLATEITNLFLEENKRSREEQTLETVSFLESQSLAYQSEIDRIDAEIAKFKSQQQGMLPENVTFNLQTLERSERQLIDIRSEIQTQEERIRYLQDERRVSMTAAGGAIDRMAVLQEEYARLSAKYSPDHPDVLNTRREIEVLQKAGEISGGSDSAIAIAQVQQELALARDRYSDDHPDVRSLAKTLAALEAQSKLSVSGGEFVTSPAVREIDSEIRERTATLSGLKQTQEALNNEISKLEKELQGVPEVERQYNTLTRRYDDAVKRYDDIQANLATAKMSSRLETEQLGQKFTPIDMPRLPKEPASPNRIGILALGIVLAGALTVAALALVEVSDSSIRSSRDVRALLGIPPLAGIPVVETISDRRKRLMRNLANASFAGLMIAVTAASFFYLST